MPLTKEESTYIANNWKQLGESLNLDISRLERKLGGSFKNSCISLDITMKELRVAIQDTKEAVKDTP